MWRLNEKIPQRMERGKRKAAWINVNVLPVPARAWTTPWDPPLSRKSQIASCSSEPVIRGDAEAGVAEDAGVVRSRVLPKFKLDMLRHPPQPGHARVNPRVDELFRVFTRVKPGFTIEGGHSIPGGAFPHDVVSPVGVPV